MEVPKVFISYAREDHVVAKRLYEDIKDAGIMGINQQKSKIRHRITKEFDL